MAFLAKVDYAATLMHYTIRKHLVGANHPNRENGVLVGRKARTDYDAQVGSRCALSKRHLEKTVGATRAWYILKSGVHGVGSQFKPTTSGSTVCNIHVDGWERHEASDVSKHLTSYP